MQDGAARVRRVQPLGLEYLKAIEGTLTEWASTPTRRRTVTYERGQVVRVPLPFTDRTASKNRPALMLSAWEAQQWAGRSGPVVNRAAIGDDGVVGASCYIRIS